MFWSKKKQPPITPTVSKEVAEHKRVIKQQVQEVNESSEKLNNAFQRNHFSIKLYVAAGGESR